MIYHVTVVLSLCLCLLTPWAATAQTAPAPTDDPLGDVVSEGEPSAEEQPAEPAPEEEPATPVRPAATLKPAPAEAPPYPAPAAEADPDADTAAVDQTASLTTTGGKTPPASGEANKANDDRCAQLMAQGQVALAQAQGCGGGDQPIWAGSLVSFTQTTAPAYRTLPDNDNGFYGLSLGFSPRITLSKKWAVNADLSMAYEVTKADDSGKQEALLGDTRLAATGNLGSVAGFTFTGGPRIVLPTSKFSRAGDVIAATGVGLNIIKSLDVLDGLALIVGGSASHTWTDNLTRERVEGNDFCQGPNNEFIACAAGNNRLIQDSFRAVAATSLNITGALNVQLSYVYGWNLVKPFPDNQAGVMTATGEALPGENVLPDTRWSRVGSLGLSTSYQPTTWFIASLQGSTSVCYGSPFGGQSALFGGCAGGMKQSSFALRNPIANKFSNVALQFTIPIDALYARIKNGSPDDKKTAAAKRAAKL